MSADHIAELSLSFARGGFDSRVQALIEASRAIPDCWCGRPRPLETRHFSAGSPEQIAFVYLSAAFRRLMDTVLSRSRDVPSKSRWGASGLMTCRSTEGTFGGCGHPGWRRRRGGGRGLVVIVRRTPAGFDGVPPRSAPGLESRARPAASRWGRETECAHPCPPEDDLDRAGCVDGARREDVLHGLQASATIDPDG